MSDTNIFPSAPSSYVGLYYIADPSSGWSVNGDNNPANCIATQSDSKTISVNLYDAWDPGPNSPYYSFGLGSLPTYITITAMTMYWYENRSGTSPGSWKGQHSLDGSNWTDNIASHTVNAGSLVSGSMARPGGGSWTRSDLSNLRVRCYPTAAASSSRVVSIDLWYVTVSWTYVVPTTVQTDDADQIGVFSARLKGTINSNGDLGGQYRFVWGTSSGSYSYSTSWTTVTDGGSNQYTHTPSLSPATNYFYRIEYRNSGLEVTNGAEKTFKTLSGGCFVMVD